MGASMLQAAITGGIPKEKMLATEPSGYRRELNTIGTTLGPSAGTTWTLMYAKKSAMQKAIRSPLSGKESLARGLQPNTFSNLIYVICANGTEKLSGATMSVPTPPLTTLKHTTMMTW